MGLICRVDGPDGPVEVLMVVASRLKLPGTEKADLLVFRRPWGRSFAGRIVVPQRSLRNPCTSDAPSGGVTRAGQRRRSGGVTGASGCVPQAASRSKARRAS